MTIDKMICILRDRYHVMPKEISNENKLVASFICYHKQISRRQNVNRKGLNDVLWKYNRELAQRGVGYMASYACFETIPHKI